MTLAKTRFDRIGIWWRGLEVKDQCSRLLARWRYPVSLPEDLAGALGVSFSNNITFDALISQLLSPRCHPKTLFKYMLRDRAEARFGSAVRRERFHERTLCSYYIHDGWMEFTLQFDPSSRLRRLYVEHKDINGGERTELPLCQWLT